MNVFQIVEDGPHVEDGAHVEDGPHVEDGAHADNFRVNTFTFVDVQGNDTVTCETRISVFDDLVSNQLLTTIKFDSRYSDGIKIQTYSDLFEHTSHPMMSYKHNNLIAHFKGFSVIKNEMTEKIIEYVMKEDYELAEFTGSTTPKSYRRSMLQSLALLSE